MKVALYCSLVLSLIAGVTGQRFGDVTECEINATTTCALADFNETTKVYPGGETACYRNITRRGNANPYFFQVNPGVGEDASNLLLHFQGGGVCRSATRCRGARSRPRLDYFGIFETTKSSNPYKNWTVVVVQYCSGDLGVGDSESEEYQFRGRKNVLSVLDWVYENVPLPDRVVVSGSSTGSFSLSYWSYTLAQHYLGLTPAPTLAFLFSDGILGKNDRLVNLTVDTFGLCDQEDFGWSAEQLASCSSKSYIGNELQLAAQALDRSVPFAYMSYKSDRRNIDYDDMQEILLEYIGASATADEDNNVISFFANTRGHGIISSSRVYRLSNGLGNSALDFVSALASFNSTTKIQSSCVEPSRGNGRGRFDCNANITIATFQGNGTLPEIEQPVCLENNADCESDSECCSGRCRVRFFGSGRSGRCRRSRRGSRRGRNSRD